MQGVRVDRVADLLKKEIADILSKKVRDPRIGFVTVTGADVSGDFRNANIYVSIQEKQDGKKVFSALKKARGFVRGELAKRLSLRRIPALTFVPDRATEKVSHLLGVLEEIGMEKENLRHQNELEENLQAPQEEAL